MPDLDTDLIAAIKQAKSKPMFFAFIPKGADGKLMISKKKIPPKQVAEAKKEIGGGNPITGKCTGPVGEFVFTVAKDPPATFLPAIKKVAKRDAGLTLIGQVQLAGDADAEEGETPESQSETAAPPAAPPPPLNLGPWQAARQKAVTDLKSLAMKVAGTKHGSAVGVLKEINSIIAKLPQNPGANDIDKIEAFVKNDDTITAAEEVPGHFHELEIRKPLLEALAAMKQ